MRKTSVDVGDRLLEKVRDVLGTSSIKETIDGTLGEVIRDEARRREIEALAVMDGLDLSDERLMAKAALPTSTTVLMDAPRGRQERIRQHGASGSASAPRTRPGSIACGYSA